jgi:CRISPR type III-B/RAMP module-associated protein Cmr5
MNRYDLDLAEAAETTLDEIRGDRKDKPVSREILSRLKGLPVMLRVNGVPATLAFYSSKVTDDKIGTAYRKVGQALRDQLAKELNWSAEPELFFQKLSETKPADLAHGFARLEAFAGWLRRLAMALALEQKRQQKSDKDTRDKPPGASTEADDDA